MKIFLTIDQIHEEKAVLLTDEPEFAFDFPTSLLPEKAQAGDVLAITMSIDSAEKLKRELEITQILQELTK